MLSRFIALLSITGLLVSAGTSRADYIFTFTDTSGNAIPSNSLTEGAGTTFSIEVWLTQRNGSTGLSATGLNQAGVQLNGYNTSNVTVGSITPNDDAHSGSFNAANTTTSINNSGSTGVAILTEGYTSPTTGLKGNPSVYLGTFTFTAGSVGTTSTVTALAYAGQDNNILADGTVIDSMIANSNLAITVTAVPEPGTMILTGMLATGIVGGYVRRRRHLSCA
jgi:hypothetical protein